MLGSLAKTVIGKKYLRLPRDRARALQIILADLDGISQTGDLKKGVVPLSQASGEAFT